jgi:energy-coupling factor transporter ATP-binding protein EcfA2
MATDFQLHQLGWKNFQQLCGTILRESLGQTYQVFADTDDGGRDGAFQGTWKPTKGERLKGTFTFQCKHSSRAGQGLSLAMLKDELGKAKQLAAKGLAQVYILITNVVVTASSEAAIRTEFESIPGLKCFRLFGKNWIEDQIRENKRIRRLIPRLYGLGDLTEILDDRAYAQASSILDHLGPDFSKFVTTEALSQAAHALEKSGFVLLLGEPCCGKSTIASALALGAADEWGSRLVFVDSPQTFRQHWNPNDPQQFFWIDDAFGSTQYERERALDWNRMFQMFHGAIRQGAKFVLTSRDYIYEAAISDLKDESFVPIRNSQVVIRVEKLTLVEKEQILYNHIKLGTQPKAVKAKIKDHLAEIASHPKFLPETARRIGDPFFTSNISFSRDSLLDMVENMRGFLLDTLKHLGNENIAAVALVFMRSGNLDCELQLSEKEQRAIDLIGSDLGSVRRACKALGCSVLTTIQNEGHPYWQFKHPSIRDSFGTLIADDPSLREVYLSYTPIRSLIFEITCGETEIANVKVQVAPSKFDLIIDRLKELKISIAADRALLISFLRNRCTNEFLKAFLEKRPRFVSSLRFTAWMQYCSELKLVAFLHGAGLLSEIERKRAVNQIGVFTRQCADAAAFFDPAIGQLLTDAERSTLISTLPKTVLASLRREISVARDYCRKQKGDPLSAFYACSKNARTFAELFPKGRFNLSLQRATKRIRKLTTTLMPKATKKKAGLATEKKEVTFSKRSIFDDVDE